MCLTMHAAHTLLMKALESRNVHGVLMSNKCMHLTSIRYCEELAGSEADHAVSI